MHFKGVELYSRDTLEKLVYFKTKQLGRIPFLLETYFKGSNPCV